MNKTLIALAIAFSAVSGTAQADWTANATGLEFQIGGTLTAATSAQPLQAGVGNDFGEIPPLSAVIKKGEQSVKFKAKHAIPVLGIRTQTSEPFIGASGISPQIDFGGAVAVAEFKDSKAPLTLEVKDDSGNKLGTLTTEIFAGAIYSAIGNEHAKAIVASGEGYAFRGGLPESKSKADTPANVESRLAKISANFAANYNALGLNLDGYSETGFSSDVTYSAYYGAGIEKDSDITIALESTPTGTIDWKATLQIKVSYM